MQGDAFAHVYLDALASGHDIGAAILVDGDRRIQHFAVLAGVVALDNQRAAAAIDDVLHLLPVEVIGRHLIFFRNQQLFGIGLFILGVVEVAVAQGDHQQAALVEIAAAKVGDVPTEHVFLDLVVFAVLVLPFVHGPGDEGRQGKFVRAINASALRIIWFSSERFIAKIPP